MTCKTGGGNRCQEYDPGNGQYIADTPGDAAYWKKKALPLKMGREQDGYDAYVDAYVNAILEAYRGVKALFVNHRLPSQPLRGTYFFGGAGMEGDYIDDMVAALREVGISSVHAADRHEWSFGDKKMDALAVPFLMSRDVISTDFGRFGSQGEQFNLIGYSFGSLKAAQAALDYADLGGRVDHLVLIGSPIGLELLQEVSSHPYIGQVVVMNLTEMGDPISAGMTFGDLVDGIPIVVKQQETREGHFHYGDPPENANHDARVERSNRRRLLVEWLYNFGMR
ncbi:MAG: hypothetical protein HQL51_07940 [Magnetococcales bacterium]|nr:hypothetical protein [Magnetococcales bacterium]